MISPFSPQNSKNPNSNGNPPSPKSGQPTSVQNSQNPNYPIIAYILPSTICKLLNTATILINIWWSRTQQILLMGMGVATVFSFTFGYLIIISLNTGLAYEISRKRNKPEKISIFYQRALLINFITCAITITPLLYISKKVVVLFSHINDHTSNIIGEYLFQLLPSIYCFAFFDTTQTYLLNQGHVLAPLIIQIVSVFLHMFLINHMGAAWAKNFTDIFCCASIYLYIQLLERPLKSWTEWTIKCIQGWGTHFKFLEIIGISTYLEIFFFFLFSLSAFKSPIDELVCHMCFINIIQIVYLILLGVKVGSLSKLGYQIKTNDFQSTKIGAEYTIKMILGCGVVFILIIFIYEDEIVNFFIRDGQAKSIFTANYWFLILTVTTTSIQSGVSSLIKALEKNFANIKLNIACYLISIVVAILLCYRYEMGFRGIWIGWNIGLILNTICCTYTLLKKYREIFMKEKKQQRLKIYNERKASKDKQKKAMEVQMSNLNRSNNQNSSNNPNSHQELETIRETDETPSATVLKTEKEN